MSLREPCCWTALTALYICPGRRKSRCRSREDIIVVVNDDAVLVMPKDKAQDVRKAVIALRDRNAEQL